MHSFLYAILPVFPSSTLQCFVFFFFSLLSLELYIYIYIYIYVIWQERRWVGSLPGKDPLEEEAWNSTPVFLPGESHEQRSLAGHSPQGRTASYSTEATQHSHTLPITKLFITGVFYDTVYVILCFFLEQTKDYQIHGSNKLHCFLFFCCYFFLFHYQFLLFIYFNLFLKVHLKIIYYNFRTVSVGRKAKYICSI